MDEFDSFHGSCVRLDASESETFVSLICLGMNGTKEAHQKFRDAIDKVKCAGRPENERNDVDELLRDVGSGGF